VDTHNFTSKLAKILETSITKVSMNDELNKFKVWDSLAMMTFVVVFKDEANKELDPMKVAKCLKVSDLYDLVS
jgi:acyl carrier protein